MLISPLKTNLDFVKPANIKNYMAVLLSRPVANRMRRYLSSSIVSYWLGRKNKPMMRNKVCAVANPNSRPKNKNHNRVEVKLVYGYLLRFIQTAPSESHLGTDMKPIPNTLRNDTP